MLSKPIKVYLLFLAEIDVVMDYKNLEYFSTTKMLIQRQV